MTSWIIAGNELKMVFIDSSPLKSQEVIAESVHLLVIQPNLVVLRGGFWSVSSSLQYSRHVIISVLERRSGAQYSQARSKAHSSAELIKEPIICSPGQQFEQVTNIRRADLDGDKGGVVPGLEGKGEDAELGIASVNGKAVQAGPIIVGPGEG